MGRNGIRMIGLSLLLAAGPIAAASAAPLSGVPVEVAPGVPSHGRAWELTTPPDPTQVNFFNGVSLAPDGDAVFYYTAGSLDDYPFTHPINKTALSVRRSTGWAVSQPAPPYSPARNGTAMVPRIFGPNDESGIWSADMPFVDPEEYPPRGLFSRGRDGNFVLLARDAEFVAASPDLERLIFASRAHYLPADAPRKDELFSLYERSEAGVRLLDSTAGGSLISPCGATAGASSENLNRVYFTANPGACTSFSRLFLAETGSAAREVSASRCTSACGLADNVTFAGATPSGSSAFLVTVEKLLDADANTHADLYRYDADDDSLALISTGSGGPDLVPTTAAVKAAADGSRAYFVAAEETGPGTTGEAGIYLADSSGVHLVAPGSEELVDVSRDGRYALLNATAPLEAGDTDGVTDAYRYDATSGASRRLSRGPAGGNGDLPAVAKGDWLSLQAGPAFRAMSEDGSHVFFGTSERLVPGDTNSVADVYEWADGDVGLISSGSGKEGSNFLTATPDGETVLFRTADTLLPADRDVDDTDLYVARVGGGFPEAGPPAPICPCARSKPSSEAIDRATVASAEPGGGRIGLRPIGLADRRRFVRSGRISLLAEVPRAGRLSASARARLGGRPRTIASADVLASAPGPMRVRMPLSRAARTRLAAGGSLHVSVRLVLSGSRDSGRSSTFRLQGG